jgi:hypothetical protein
LIRVRPSDATSDARAFLDSVASSALLR